MSASFAADDAGPQGSGAAAEVTFELNKLEQQGADCQVRFVITNASTIAYESFQLSLVTFGADGIIDREVSVEFAPLRPAKRAVKSFILKNHACETVASVLINDVVGCGSSAGAVADCLARIVVASKAPVPLTK